MIGIISGLQHPNLIKLYGCCVEGNQLMLVYEYMENNSVSHALFGKDAPLKLDWPTRWKICLGIARDLAYLHEESGLKIVHRDIKTSNVFLDKDLSAKISDFGLAKLYEDDNTHINTRLLELWGIWHLNMKCGVTEPRNQMFIASAQSRWSWLVGEASIATIVYFFVIGPLT